MSPAATVSATDREILRGLAGEAAAIAALPAQEETRRLWRALNRRQPVRPMVMIDQVCWSELEAADPAALAAAADRNQDRLKETGDWVIMPRTIEAIARGWFARDGRGRVYYQGRPAPIALEA